MRRFGVLPSRRFRGIITGIFCRNPTTCHERSTRIVEDLSASALRLCKDSSHLYCNNYEAVVARNDAMKKLNDFPPGAMDDPQT